MGMLTYIADTPSDGMIIYRRGAAIARLVRGSGGPRPPFTLVGHLEEDGSRLCFRTLSPMYAFFLGTSGCLKPVHASVDASYRRKPCRRRASRRWLCDPYLAPEPWDRT